jgi:hypothetical protein
MDEKAGGKAILDREKASPLACPDNWLEANNLLD